MHRNLFHGSILLLALVSASGCTSSSPSPQRAKSTFIEAHSAPGGPGVAVVPEAPNLQYRSASRRHGQASAISAPPGQFDFYLFNLSWSPEFCATHPSSPECAAHPGFVVHGLWPQNDDGTYPEGCGNAPGPANPQGDTDLMPTVSLVEHEWQTHGTCSGLSADAYFNSVRQAFHEIVIPPSFQSDHSSQTLAPQAILQQFASANPSLPAGSFALTCGNNHLTAVEVCLTKSLAGESCPSLRTCGATVIQVTPQ